MTARICPWCHENEHVNEPEGAWCCETAYQMETAYTEHDPHDDPEHVARLMAFAEAGGWMDGDA
jgi:hypothetical protein